MTRFLENNQRAYESAKNLNEYVERQTSFNINERAHIKLVNDCITELTSSQEALQKIDLNIVTGFSVGFGAYILSFLPFFSTAAVAGIGYGCYQLALRQSANEKYQHALETLVKCSNWSLKNVSSADEAECIKQMIKTLAPLVPASKIPDNFKSIADSVREKGLVVEGHQLSKEEQGLYFSLYGYQQGAWIHMFRAVLQIVPQAFSKMSTYMPWNQKQAVEITVSEAAQVTAAVA